MVTPVFVIFVALLSTPWNVPSGGLRPGVAAPAFELPRMTKGKVNSKVAFKDRVGILVIGSTEAAAPACRKWMMSLDEQYKSSSDVALFQVAVLNASWFVPHFAVKAKLRDYVPEHGYHKVLLEWGLDFAKRYHIQKTDFPRVVVIDSKGIIRLWLEGPMTKARLAQTGKLISSLQSPAGSANSADQGHNVE